MSVKFRHFLSFFLAGLALIIIFFLKIYSLYPFFVENFYSRKFYLKLSDGLRSFFGKIPFNIGDFLFIFFFFFFFILAFRIVWLIWNRKYSTIFNKRVLLLCFIIVAYNYIFFTLFWGLNYKRIPLSEQLDLPAITYSDSDEIYLVSVLAKKVNALADTVYPLRASCQNFRAARTLVLEQMRTLDTAACARTRDSVLVFDYLHSSVKQSVLGFFLNKMGIAGYHHPFTGEAVINSDIPTILLPAVMVHEIMHQLGYPKEEEAELAAHIFARHIQEPVVRYSIYLDCLLTVLMNLRKTNIVRYEESVSLLHGGVRWDVDNFFAYLSKNKKPFLLFNSKLYAAFFAVNTTLQGVEAQSRAMQLIVAYNRSQDAILQPKTTDKPLVRRYFDP